MGSHEGEASMKGHRPFFFSPFIFISWRLITLQGTIFFCDLGPLLLGDSAEQATQWPWQFLITQGSFNNFFTSEKIITVCEGFSQPFH